MRKLFAFLLVLIWLVPSALAEELPHGLQLEINGMSLTDEWVDEKSDTHDWLAVDVTITNWDMDTASLSERIAASLTYMEQYSFDGELIFASDSIEPLVQLDGTLLYRIPKMVSAALEKAEISISVDGNQISPEIVVSSRSLRSHSDSFECGGFDSPQDAVMAYIEALNQGDVTGMLSTFSIETFVDSLDRHAYLERLRAFSPSSYGTYPMPSDYVRNILVSARWGDLVRALADQYMFYGWYDAYGEEYDKKMKSFTGDDAPQQISEFLDMFAQVDLNFWTGNIEFIDFVDITQWGETYEWTQSEAYLKKLNQVKANYRCDEIEQVVAHFRANGKEYLQFMQCVKYGDHWYNDSLNGDLALLLNLNPYINGLVPMDALT